MRFAVASFLIAALLLAAAASVPSPERWLFVWPIVDALWIGLAYATLNPKLVGKRPNGQLPVWAQLVHAPYLSATHAVWVLQRLLSKEDPTNEVSPGIWVGRRPSLKDLPPDCELVVDLTCEFSVHPRLKKAAPVLGLPTLDGVPREDVESS